MEAIPTSRRTTTELHHMRNKWKDPRTAERSPEHTKVWIEPPPTTNKPRTVAVVYYLSRNGNLEHPHFIEVPLSSNGLYLRDVIDRLNSLRGNGMAASYSWSCKRRYKNGFVWNDLSENDFIYPVHGQDYVLKGSELIVAGSEPHDSSAAGVDFPVIKHRRNQSWSSHDLHVFSAGTQTDEKRRRRRAVTKKEEGKEFSSPPFDSSPETLESVMKADGLIIVRPETEDRKQKSNPTDGKASASSVLMQLISCGSISLRGPGGTPSFSHISHYKSKRMVGGYENGVVLRKDRRNKKPMVTQDKEYFCGSLLETKKEKFPAVKRYKSCKGNP